MVFEKMAPSKIKSTEKAVKVSHIFYILALLIHSLFFMFTSFELNASFWILISGFLIQSVSEFIFRKRAGGSDD